MRITNGTLLFSIGKAVQYYTTLQTIVYQFAIDLYGIFLSYNIFRLVTDQWKISSLVSKKRP